MSYDPNYQQQWAPQPPKKNKAGKIAAIGCGSVVALIVFGGFVAAITSSDDDGPKNASSAAPAATKDTPLPKHTATKPTKKHTPAPVKKPEPKPDVVTFKVWGNAPAGALGSLDISYGSDSDSRKGSFKNGTFTATLPLDKDALYYTLNAQLQGSGDINCSVTVDGKTKKGHASGGYNICDAQLSPGLLGGWD